MYLPKLGYKKTVASALLSLSLPPPLSLCLSLFPPPSLLPFISVSYQLSLEGNWLQYCREAQVAEPDGGLYRTVRGTDSFSPTDCESLRRANDSVSRLGSKSFSLS